jgi:UDP-N-acetylmuramoyl-L-alanyl-D-glutamate--2,6-diaminopimelate ligase
VTVVFGCGGDRDAGKRPLMGAVAAELADSIVLTDDNPRSESPRVSLRISSRDLPAAHAARVIHDRAAAILDALAGASPADAVLIAGKGHEDYQIVGAEKRPFSDRDVARECLSSAGQMETA